MNILIIRRDKHSGIECNYNYPIHRDLFNLKADYLLTTTNALTLIILVLCSITTVYLIIIDLGPICRRMILWCLLFSLIGDNIHYHHVPVTCSFPINHHSRNQLIPSTLPDSQRSHSHGCLIISYKLWQWWAGELRQHELARAVPPREEVLELGL